MKKLVLVMVFLLLTAVFIAFNYLLWERESREAEIKNLESTNASNNANINAQNREIESLEKEIGDLGNKIAQLESENNRLLKDKIDLAGQKAEVENTLKDKINFINAIKQYIDLGVVSEPLKKWADALNQGRYDEAYELEYAGIRPEERPMDKAAYAEAMRKTVKKIEINEIRMDKLRGSSDGEIYLEVRMNVKPADNADKSGSRFSEGLNVIYVKEDYSYDKKAFIISSISNY